MENRKLYKKYGNTTSTLSISRYLHLLVTYKSVLMFHVYLISISPFSNYKKSSNSYYSYEKQKLI